jgi:hypothetical protein
MELLSTSLSWLDCIKEVVCPSGHLWQMFLGVFLIISFIELKPKWYMEIHFIQSVSQKKLTIWSQSSSKELSKPSMHVIHGSISLKCRVFFTRSQVWFKIPCFWQAPRWHQCCWLMDNSLSSKAWGIYNLAEDKGFIFETE